MKLCAEMKKLRDYLDSTCIPWEDKSEVGQHLQIERTHFFVKKNGCKWSVIHGFGTYGGWSTYEIDKGLLELLAEDVNNGEPVGYLTAEDVICWIKLKKIREVEE